MNKPFRCLPVQLEVIKTVQPCQIGLISRLPATEPLSRQVLDFLLRNGHPVAATGRRINRLNRSLRKASSKASPGMRLLSRESGTPQGSQAVRKAVNLPFRSFADSRLNSFLNAAVRFIRGR